MGNDSTGKPGNDRGPNPGSQSGGEGIRPNEKAPARQPDAMDEPVNTTGGKSSRSETGKVNPDSSSDGDRADPTADPSDDRGNRTPLNVEREGARRGQEGSSNAQRTTKQGGAPGSSKRDQ
ncbi:MAG: hypothetical protein ABI639_06240 [Thermoanaerobaculia bacterium]